MNLLRPGLAVINPLLNGFVFFPCVVAGEGLHSLKVWVIEDLILPLQDLQGLLSSLVLINIGL